MPLEEEIVSLLHARIGFNPHSVGSDKVLAAVRACLEGQAIADPRKYIEGLQKGNQAFQEIVDAVVIPETWFFRDGAPFELMKRYVVEWLPRSKGQVLRCLSLPCSTGEEPYSIAMALLDQGMPRDRFSVDGVDISSKLLERAKKGVFGAYSFRSEDLSFRERHFEARGAQYHLKKTVCESVRFERGNMLEPMFMNDGRQYEIIFCRNLLIYFDRTSWNTALKTLGRLLKDNGLLFMGHAEMLDLASVDFESVRFPGGFAYRKRNPEAPQAHPRAPQAKQTTARTRKSTALHRTAKTAQPAQPRPSLKSRGAEKPSAEQAKAGIPELKKAKELADAGRLEEAVVACTAHLARNPGSAEAYFLMGLAKESGGQAHEAESCYRRAVYLDSKHDEAMIHLALLLEGRGDVSGAATLRRRAARARPTP